MHVGWALPELLSQARLAPYEAAVRGSDVQPLSLYDWNTQASGAFYESLHYLEVGLRNAMDSELTNWLQRQGLEEHWFLHPAVDLTTSSRHRVRQAIVRANEGDARLVHGKVVAELSFGFWWSLLAQGYNRSLWQPCLRHAFEGPVKRQRLHNELNRLRELRNRIAHHEPIHCRDLGEDFSRLCATAGRVAAVLREHIEATTRVPEVLAAKPLLP